VSWNARVMRPIWVNVRAYDAFSTGYTAEISDWIVSFRRCDTLSATRTATAAPCPREPSVFSPTGPSRSPVNCHSR
jgi:hypothetical protein